MTKAFHIGQASSHIALSKCCTEMGKFLGLASDAATKSAQGIRDDCAASMAAVCKEMAGHHADIAGLHVEAAKAMADDNSDDDTDNTRKAAFGMPSMRDFSQVMPTKVHGVIPSGLRAVARPGSPPILGASEVDATDALDRALGR